MSGQRAGERGRERERLRERETERERDIGRGGTSERRFMFPIKRLRSQHVAQSKWAVTQSPREVQRLAAYSGSRSLLLSP